MKTETGNAVHDNPAPAPDADGEVISLYQAHKKIYPRSVSGVFANWRWGMVFLTQIVFYGLPWLEWGQRQMVLFDLGARRFYIFGLVLYPQDFIYLTGMLVVSALSLFLFTAVAGRLWCGYACPQTVYTEIFLWIERKFEGDRSAQMRRDAQPLSLDKVWRKGGKHLAWLAVALWTGFTFVGYFTPIRTLGLECCSPVMGPWETFWSRLLRLRHLRQCRLHARAGLQIHVPLRPLPERDVRQGHPDRDLRHATRRAARCKRSRKADPAALNLGACTDCSLCVQVCPTGIDIRKGLQYECIGCGACADVCDTVMDKMGYARGLVRYTTENAMKRQWTRAQTLRHVLRPRILIYTSILLAIVIAMGVSMALRTPFKVNVVRDRGVLARIVERGRIENVYQLQIMNATEATQKYRITAEGLPGLAIASENVVTVDSTQAVRLAVRVQAPYDVAAPGTHPIRFEIESMHAPGHLTEKSMFMVPR
jgi:polyferredoxin